MPLRTKEISESSHDILNVDGALTTTPKQVKDGDGIGCPIYLSTSKVGIRTGDPDIGFTVSANSGDDAEISLWADQGDDADDGWKLSSLNSAHKFQISSSKTAGLPGTPAYDARITIDGTNGKVGIGTDSPSAKLHIDGDFIIDTDGSNQPFYITRSGGTGEGLKIYVDDFNTIFESIQDESGDSYGGFDFKMDSGTSDPDFRILKGTTELVRVCGAGNVGIGTTSPKSLLQLSTATHLDEISAGTYLLNNTYNDGAWKYTTTAQVTTMEMHATAGFNIFTAPSGTAGTTPTFTNRFHIDNTGNVGIGTNSPGALLEISKQVAASAGAVPFLILDATETGADNLVGGEGASILFKVPDDTNPGVSYSEVGASIAGVKTSAGDSNSSTALVFSVSQDDETLDEAMRIDEDGNVGIAQDEPDELLCVGDGTVIEPFIKVDGGGSGKDFGIKIRANSIHSNTTAPNVLFLEAQDQIRIYTNADTSPLISMTIKDDGVVQIHEIASGAISADGSGNLSGASDERLKNKTRDIQSGLTLVNQLAPTYFEWKEDSGFVWDGECLGFIAQDVHSVIPEGVYIPEDPDKHLGYDDRALIAVLVKAVQELSVKVDELTNEGE